MIMCFAGGFMSDFSLLGTVLNLFDNFLSFTFPFHSSPFTLSTIPTQWIWSFHWRASNFLIYFCCCCYCCCFPLSFCWHLLYFWEMFVTFKLSFFDVCNIFTYLNHVITDFFFLFQSLFSRLPFLLCCCCSWYFFCTLVLVCVFHVRLPALGNDFKSDISSLGTSSYANSSTSSSTCSVWASS